MTNSKRIPMATLVYLFGLFQGFIFVTVPAASNFLMSSEGFGFSSSEYGFLFIPMIIGSIIMSIFGSRLAENMGLKKIAVMSFIFSMIAMALMCITSFYRNDHTFSLSLFLILMLFLGSGFGGCISMLNVYTVTMFPKKASTAITCLHTLLGIGCFLSPKIFTYFYKLQEWWKDPLILGAAFLLLTLLFIAIVPKSFGPEKKGPKGTQNPQSTKKSQVLYLAFCITLFLYGLCETAFGNWGSVYLHSEKGINIDNANNALSLFWGFVTLGRLCSAGLTLKIEPRKVFLVLPVLLTVAFILLPNFSSGTLSDYILFSFAGLACSSFFPLGVSLSTTYFSEHAEKTSGMMVGLYLLGYGASSEGYGFLHEILQTSYSSLFLGTSVIALITLFLNAYIFKSLKR